MLSQTHTHTHRHAKGPTGQARNGIENARSTIELVDKVNDNGNDYICDSANQFLVKSRLEPNVNGTSGSNCTTYTFTFLLYLIL